MEHITVKVSVVCPTHHQIIRYMEARHWRLVARRKRNEGPTYSRWQMKDKHYIIDIYESPEFPDYYIRQRNAVILLADYDNWLDEYSLVAQLLRGGIMAEDDGTGQPDNDKTEVYFSDMGAGDNSSRVGSGGFWQALDPMAYVI